MLAKPFAEQIKRKIIINEVNGLNNIFMFTQVVFRVQNVSFSILHTRVMRGMVSLPVCQLSKAKQA